MKSIPSPASTPSASLQRHPATSLLACLVGLAGLLASSSASAQFLPLDPTQVVINSGGGQTSNDGLRIHLGNRGGIQVVRAGSGQYYGDVPTGPEGVNNGFFMAVGTSGSATVYGPQLDIDWTATAWTAVSQSAVTGAGTAEDPFQVVTIVSAAGFRLGQTVRYVTPSPYFDIRLTLVPPAGNADDVRIYHWLDTYLAGGDFGPAYWEPLVGNPTVVGVAKGNQYGVMIQGSRAWDAYFSGAYYLPGELMELGGSLDNTLDTNVNTDNGFAAQWNLGAPSGPVTWTYRLATAEFVASTCGDGVIDGFEGCDDADTDDNDGCSSICQVEVGYACTGAPSTCEECFEDIDCDDGDDCTLDTCVANACGHAPAATGSACLTGVCDSGGSCVECLQDADCGPNAPLCDTQDNTCYCALDADCDDSNECTSETCTLGQCVFTALPLNTLCDIGHCNADADAPACVCDIDTDCDDGNSCSVEVCNAGECVYDYADAGDACATGFCSGDATPLCVECFTDGNCDDAEECTLDLCTNDVCSNDLRVGEACQAGGVCSDDGPVCVQCVTNADCSSTRPRCANHECVACFTDLQCNDGNDCTADTCNDLGSCRHEAVEPGTACTGGYCAGTSSPACVTCADSQVDALDDGCSDDLPVCLVVGNGSSCVSCEASDAASGDFGCGGETPFCNEEVTPRTCIGCRTSDDCAEGETCSTAGACSASCENDDDCVDATASHCVVESGECVECLGDDDCQGDDTCSSEGRCRGIDTDGDGVDDADDLDDDNDGISDVNETSDEGDLDGDGLPNALDRDSDGDGISDVVEAGGADSDGNGVWDDFVDANRNGLADDREGAIPPGDNDTDGTPDFVDTDSDDDGIDDAVEAHDADYDGIADRPASGQDADNDGLDDEFDSSEGGSSIVLLDRDDDGVPDYLDPDRQVVTPVDSGVAPGPGDEMDAGVPPDSTEEPTSEEPSEAGTVEETEEPTNEEPSEAGTTEVTEEPTGETADAEASSEPDASTPEVVADAGADDDATDDGCDCHVVGGQSTRGASWALWLLALTGLLLKRRTRTT